VPDLCGHLPLLRVQWRPLRVAEPLLWDDTGVRSRPDRAAPTRWMRVLCGSLGALFATFVAAFSHVLAGGAPPSTAAMMLSLALSIPLCVALVGPALSLWRTTTAVALSQAMFHGLFSGISSSGSVMMTEHAGHDGTAVTILGAGGGVAPGASHAASMWLAHAAAAALTVVALRYAESAVLRLREATVLFLGTLAALITAVPMLGAPRTPRVGCTRTVLPRDLTLLFSALRHRGPPVPRAA
jgi:hypothetical protein